MGCKSLISANCRPIRPRFTPYIPRERIQETPHGRPFPIQEHHAPQGPAGCPEVQAVQQAGPRNHGRRQAWNAGPGGVAIIVEALTDNRNRAASDIRSYFTKSGGNLGETGSVAFMFDRTGIIEYDASKASDDAMLDAAIEAGADDVVSSESGHEIYASQETFREVAKALEAKFGEARKAALTWKPQNTVAVDDETGEKLLKLIDALNEHDDVQNVYANFEVSDALMAKMGG